MNANEKLMYWKCYGYPLVQAQSSVPHSSIILTFFLSSTTHRFLFCFIISTFRLFSQLLISDYYKF